MVTKESLIQEIVKSFEPNGVYVNPDGFSETIGIIRRYEFNGTLRSILNRHIEFLRCAAPPCISTNVDDTLNQIIDKIVERYNTPICLGSELTPVYPLEFVFLPNSNLAQRRLNAYVYKDEGVEDVIDAFTGEKIMPNELMVRYKEGFIKVCNLDEDFYVCQDCGELCNENEAESIGNSYRVCEHCNYNNDWYVCDRCGEPVYYDNSYTVRTRYGEETWCEDCECSYSTRCCECDELFSDDDFNLTETRDGEYVCDDCLDYYYRRCEECDELVREEYIVYDEDEDMHVCRSCYRRAHNGRLPGEYERVIDSYHTHHHNSNMTFGESNKRSGLELEVEGASKTSKELNEMAKELIDMSTDKDGNKHIYCENDGSLCGGFEIITNPHTPEELFKLPLKEMLQKLIDNGYTSHNNGRCGLHIHFSNEWFGDDYDEIDDNVSKVVHFYSENYDTMFKLSRRTQNSADSWARRFKVDDFEDSKIMKSSSTGHGTAVNLGNMNTIHTVEFRLGRGTLIYESFMAWLDIHFAIVRNVRNIAKNDTDINKWLAGISEETKEYIRNRADIEIVDAEREVA